MGPPAGERCSAGGRRPSTAAGLARAQDGLEVHDRGALLGWIVTKREGFDAIAVTGAMLGKFNTAPAAARALLQKAHHGKAAP